MTITADTTKYLVFFNVATCFGLVWSSSRYHQNIKKDIKLQALEMRPNFYKSYLIFLM
jgi:hypothetical protein